MVNDPGPRLPSERKLIFIIIAMVVLIAGIQLFLDVEEFSPCGEYHDELTFVPSRFERRGDRIYTKPAYWQVEKVCDGRIR